MQYKFDYLAFTIKPNFEVNNILSFSDWIICDLLHMKDHYFDFIASKASGFYDIKYSFHNIFVKSPPSYNLNEGFQVEMTGGGFDYYIQYRKSIDSDFTIRRFLSNICSLFEYDLYKVNFTRLDVAIDDISYEDKDKYLLNFDEIKNSVLNGEVVTRFRHRMAVIGGEIELPYDKSTEFVIYQKGSTHIKLKGSTVYLGSRKRTHCRFYDKISELKAHGKEFDENIKHWVRFEMQFCRDNAFSLIEKLIELPTDDFSRYLSEVFNNMVRFIDITENNPSNYYRCPSKKWWSDFIGTFSKSKLIHKKPSVNHFVKASNWIENSAAATIYKICECKGIESFLSLVKSGAQKHLKANHNVISDDYINYGNFDIPEPVGLDRFGLFTDDESSFRQFLFELRRLREKNILAIMDNGVKAAKHTFDFGVQNE